MQHKYSETQILLSMLQMWKLQTRKVDGLGKDQATGYTAEPGLLCRFSDPESNKLWVEPGHMCTCGKGKLIFGRAALRPPEDVLSLKGRCHRVAAFKTLGKVQRFYPKAWISHKWQSGPSAHKTATNGCQPPVPTGEVVLEIHWHLASTTGTSSTEINTHQTKTKGPFPCANIILLI